MLLFRLPELRFQHGLCLFTVSRRNSLAGLIRSKYVECDGMPLYIDCLCACCHGGRASKAHSRTSCRGTFPNSMLPRNARTIRCVVYENEAWPKPPATAVVRCGSGLCIASCARRSSSFILMLPASAGTCPVEIITAFVFGVCAFVASSENSCKSCLSVGTLAYNHAFASGSLPYVAGLEAYVTPLQYSSRLAVNKGNWAFSSLSCTYVRSCALLVHTLILHD